MVTMTVLNADETFATSELRVSLFRPVKRGTLTMEGQVIHRSRNMVHAEVVLSDENDQLIAKATAIQVVLRS